MHKWLGYFRFATRIHALWMYGNGLGGRSNGLGGNRAELLDSHPPVRFHPAMFTKANVGTIGHAAHRQQFNRTMKTLLTTLSILTAVLFFKSTAQAADAPQVASDSLEIVLNCNVYLFSATNSTLEVTFRNIGETNLNRESLENGLTVIWDGKEYAREPIPIIYVGTGAGDITPMGEFYLHYSLSNFLIPASALTSGKHKLAVRNGSAESNTLTVFLNPQR